MQSSTTSYSLTKLAKAADVSSRTIRYYIQHGLLPSPHGGGPGSHYDYGHLARLRLIKRLQDTHLPLAEIRKQIKPLSDDEVHAILKKEHDEVSDTAVEYIRSVLNVRETALREAASPPALHWFAKRVPSCLEPQPVEPTRAHWERIGLSPDIELHVRRPLSHQENKAVNRILEVAREILKEETQ
jgi:DNA-binding transcriptional MerR regulator